MDHTFAYWIGSVFVANLKNGKQSQYLKSQTFRFKEELTQNVVTYTFLFLFLQLLLCYREFLPWRKWFAHAHEWSNFLKTFQISLPVETYFWGRFGVSHTHTRLKITTETLAHSYTQPEAPLWYYCYRCWCCCWWTSL